jgi:hypothetical protein
MGPPITFVRIFEENQRLHKENQRLREDVRERDEKLKGK